jgi:hypothetical protein
MAAAASLPPLATPSTDAADALRQEPPPPLVGVPDGHHLESLDGVSVRLLLGLDGGHFPHLRALPLGLRESWAEAVADVVTWLEEAILANKPVWRDRALKAMHLLCVLLFRVSPGASARHAQAAAARLAQWHGGDIGGVVRDFLADCDANSARATPRPAARSAADDDERQLRKALRLLEGNDLARARRLLTSSGTADLTDPQVVAALGALHPQDRRPIDASPLADPAFAAHLGRRD